jgi:DNA-binding transcriptional LysR family regulator
MNRETLLHLPVVAVVARRRSFAGAAAELGLGASAVSHAVRVVEQQIGLPLFHRTTRSVSLTEAGESFLARAVPALAELNDAVESTQALRGRVTGILRINAPRVALPMVMTRVLAELGLRHPNLVVETTSEDALVDIVAGGYDAGIRLGEMISEDMVASRLTAPFKAIMVASPDYLSRAGEPTKLSHLRAHNAIGYRLASSGAEYEWDLSNHGTDVSVPVAGTTRVTDPLFALDLALAGVGIAYLFEPLVRTHIRSGALRWLVPDASIQEPGLFLYFPRRAAQVPKLRAFIDVAREQMLKATDAAIQSQQSLELGR